MCSEFGIVTGPADQNIPDSVYDMPELQNNAEGGSRRAAKRRRVVSTRPLQMSPCKKAWQSQPQSLLVANLSSFYRNTFRILRVTRRRHLRMRTTAMITKMRTRTRTNMSEGFPILSYSSSVRMSHQEAVFVPQFIYWLRMHKLLRALLTERKLKTWPLWLAAIYTTQLFIHIHSIDQLSIIGVVMLVHI